MAQHGPTMSPDLIYMPYWEIKQGWAKDRAEYEERERKRQERRYLRFIRTAEGAAWLKEMRQQAEEHAYDVEMAARDADHLKRIEAVQKQFGQIRRSTPRNRAPSAKSKS